MLNCRSCLSKHVKSIIPLGELPLANGLLASNDKTESLHNLEVMLCMDCGLAQLKNLIDPKELFSNYVYFSSNSETVLKSAIDLVEKNLPRLTEDSLVIEIASNDGYLLKNYVKNKIKVLGIEPAKNIAKVAQEKGIPTLCEFFNEELALKLVNDNKQADIIHANNVMAHIPDINNFIKGIKHLLKNKGYAIIEVPYLLELVQKLEFDTIYHEHVFYFSVKPLNTAFKRNGLEIFDIEKITLHGGTIRLFVGHTNIHNISSIVEDLIKLEEDSKLYHIETFRNFMKQIDKLKLKLVNALKEIKKCEGKIAAYGASAKGTTLLNYFGINKNYLEFVVDKSLVKQGFFTPGTRLEIKNPKTFIEEHITHALLLAWNFADEIIEQQKEFIAKKGKFIVPLPEVKITP